MKRDAVRSSYSWGYFRSAWVYGETFEVAVAAGLDWVAGCRQKEARHE